MFRTVCSVQVSPRFGNMMLRWPTPWKKAVKSIPFHSPPKPVSYTHLDVYKRQNIVSDSVLQYGWYAKRMEEAVRHVRVCFPDADILMPVSYTHLAGAVRRTRSRFRSGYVGSRPVPSDDRAKGGRLDHLVHVDGSSSSVYALCV